MSRAVILVLDSFGVGATPDAERFGDVNANTLGSIARYCREAFERGERAKPLTLPNLSRMGLMHAARLVTGQWVDGEPEIEPNAAWGCAAELSSGKDTPSGHWEIAGCPVMFDWGYFENRESAFPSELLDALISRAELPGVLGNCHASGTEIIKELGEAHCRTGKPIVYTSADSVFQIAAHEEAFGLDRLYALCEIARELVDEYRVGRVIARPFVGDDAASFIRTGNRRDLTTPPHAPTLLDKLIESGGEVVSVGKIADIFAHRGISKTVKATGNEALVAATLEAIAAAGDRSLVFTNLVDFDMLYGHRRDPAGYANALEAFDAVLPKIRAALNPDDLLILCADHGCDPTWPGTDHTREYIPVLVAGGGIAAGSIGKRDSFADIGQTLAEHFDLAPLPYGQEFLKAG
ncbi:MAG: phosphopentomutase [Pseudomonadota bacterium]